MSVRPTARVLAPAKINLGLELLGKRPDGYHEIRTVMAMIGLVDEIRIIPSFADGISMRPDLGGVDNLIAVARDRFNAAVGTGRVQIDLTKHIPIAGGLGGASTNAAATLLALNTLQSEVDRLSGAFLREIAASIGSDIPFFLGSPIAFASGTGTEVTPLPALTTTVQAVLVTPPIDLPKKTATLYRTIQPSDFTDGTRTDMLVEAIRDGATIPFDGEMLANPFRSAWNRLGDPLAPIEATMLQAGAPWVALSGAGPTIYTIVADDRAALVLSQRFREVLPHNVVIHHAPILNRGVIVELDGAP